MRYKYVWVISFFYMLIFITIIIIMKYNETKIETELLIWQLLK